MKSIFKFIIILLPWFLSSLTPINKTYYDSLNLPFFAPPQIVYGIIWTIIYILIAISIYQLINFHNKKDIPNSYKYTLLINYIANQSFQPIFFLLKSNFLAFLSCITTFISSLFLYKETKDLQERSAKFLIPYILFSLFATILSLTIYLLNLTQQYAYYIHELQTNIFVALFLIQKSVPHKRKDYSLYS